MVTSKSEQASGTDAEPEARNPVPAPAVVDISPGKPTRKGKNASMEAFSGGEQRQEPSDGASAAELREAAIEEAKRYQVARESHEDNADKASWTLIRLMLRIVESYEGADGSLNEPEFQQFLKDNGAPPRTNAGSDSHRLAKACMPRGMKFSKLGGAIHALRTRGIKSDTVLSELEQRLPIKEGGPSHFGAHRFFLLYQEDKREQAERDKADDEPTNPYAKWTRTKLIEQGKLLLEVLWKQGLIPAEFEGIETALSDLASAE